MAPIWSKQPFRALLTVALFLITPPYLAFLTLYYLPRSSRPHTSWSISRSLANELLRIVFGWTTYVRPPPEYISSPGKLKDRFVSVEPGPGYHYSGVLDDPIAKPTTVTAVWFPKVPSEHEKVTSRFVLHLPGGAFVLAANPNKIGKEATDIFSEKLDAFTFYAQYRVSRDHFTRFPAALIDAVSFYYHMLSVGIPSKSIIISGDSAGANLALALTRYIEENNLPKPLGTMAWAPWLEVNQRAVQGYKTCPQNRTDFLSWKLLDWGLREYTPTRISTIQQKYISPAQNPFATTIPIFIQAGTCEIFLQEIRRFSERMKTFEPNKVKVVEIYGAMHNVLQAWKLTGYRKEVEDAAEIAGTFFDQST